MLRGFARVLVGWMVLGIVYIITYTLMVRAYSVPRQGLVWTMTTPMAVGLITVPYIVGGAYCGLTGKDIPHSYKWVTPAVPVLSGAKPLRTSLRHAYYWGA